MEDKDGPSSSQSRSMKSCAKDSRSQKSFTTNSRSQEFYSAESCSHESRRPGRSVQFSLSSSQLSPSNAASVETVTNAPSACLVLYRNVAVIECSGSSSGSGSGSAMGVSRSSAERAEQYASDDDSAISDAWELGRITLAGYTGVPLPSTPAQRGLHIDLQEAEGRLEQPLSPPLTRCRSFMKALGRSLQHLSARVAASFGLSRTQTQWYRHCWQHPGPRPRGLNILGPRQGFGGSMLPTRPEDYLGGIRRNVSFKQLAKLAYAQYLPIYMIIELSGCCGSTKKRTIVGGWAWAWWLVTDVQRLSLNVMTLNPMCMNVETAQGVPLTITGVAQCKIMKSSSYKNKDYNNDEADELLGTASEQFLGKSVKEIKQTILQTLEGHLRAILGTLTVEEVYKDRDQFAALVREVAAPDVGRMGIEILSFTIKDVYDEVQYLASLGKAQTAVVKRDADAGVAEANRDAGIREAECEKSAMDVKYSTDTKIEDNTRMYKLQKANFDQEINTAKAESQLAYELQAAKIRQRIRNEEIQIEVVERRKQIEIESQEVQRKDRELIGTVKLPAEAEAYRVQTIAQGKQCQTIEAARAEAERIRKIGSAEAHAIELVGKAEAERMRMKAHVYKQYGDAAIMSIVLESLPKIAAEVAAPLAKTEEIVLIGGNDNITNDVTRLVAQLPPSISALTGVDLSKVLSKIPGAKA